MKDTTRRILIDPIANAITNIDVSCVNASEQIHKIIGCEFCCQVDFGGRVFLTVDDEGMLYIPRETHPPYDIVQGFFVIHTGDMARNLIAGRGILWAYNAEGETIDLPDGIQPGAIAEVIKFVPAERRNVAADLCQRILTEGGINKAEILNQALALCRN